MQPAGYIDGRYAAGEGAPLTVENPSDQSIVGQLNGLSLEQVESAIAASRTAFDRGGWSALPMAERASILHRFVSAIEARADETRALLVAETGCPPSSPAFFAQFDAGMRMAHETIDFVASLPETEEIPLPPAEAVNRAGQPVRSTRHYLPLGVVAGISAYNFPIYTGIWKIIPALIAGNTMIIRPNPLTPLSSMVFADAAEAVKLPPGILNVLIEAGAEGATRLTNDKRVDMVSFTGSTAIGAEVAMQAARSFKRVQLELGGKSAQIFLPDMAEAAAATAAGLCTLHAGQGCVLGTRLFVPDALKDEIVRTAAAAVSALRVGPADDPDAEVGPVISAAQVARCEHFVQEAVAHGGRVAAGGKRPAHLNRGYYFEPTVLDLPDNANPAAQEEIFGPVLAVIGYRDIDHAIEMANDSRYGLSGYVHGRDTEQALAVARRIHSGTVQVNGALSSSHVPFGGIKSSGIGVERGVEGARLFQRLTMINVTG